ncbi:AlkA N-terminal domain-containing protein [Streptomyces aidingensis]|uniref:DNA-3-methyladenine glycosylase II n=1 Tax=Streptomyces aidingensis TaxID=910347 RepID=A0A1I1IRY9_9ACTN|nr:AlkA N-terminal domain-containing protein [Streptomyces aidingensis]SFC38711.1 AraC family transcriptional regulator, regulatory protein of adaptative response / DNA-3-methyladenine glycosylase II [Streptomyces aidingensis]
MDDNTRYEAVRSRDGRFDGVFFTCVLSTGIYCRPSCPARTPKRENVRFQSSAAAAQAAGFRACRRCRPDAVPGSAEWNVRADAVGRAMRMIADGVVDREGVAGLARRLGYSARQVQRQLTAELGAGASALARAQRAHTARLLLQTTQLPITEIAFAAGFSSVRQFNDTMREIYARTPRELRREHASRTPVRAARGADGTSTQGRVALRLAYRGPYAAREIFDFLARRAIAGIEEVTGEPGARTYRRTLRLPYGWGVTEVEERTPPGGTWLDCRLTLSDLRDLTTAVQRTRRLFDLDADPGAVAERLAADPLVGPLAARRPGLRSPGAAEPGELAVRAVLGQQVTVSAARTLGGLLVAAHGTALPVRDGGLTQLFPEPGELAEAALAELPMPAARRAAVRTLCGALAEGGVVLEPGVCRDETERALLNLRGIGPWTAGYIRMRALGDPDVFLSGDAGVRHGLLAVAASGASDAAWRPWRSYAVHHLWNAPPAPAPNRAPNPVTNPVTHPMTDPMTDPMTKEPRP